jgi:hypothetical protein
MQAPVAGVVTFRCIKFHLFYVKYILASTPYVPNLTVAYVPNLPRNVPNLTGASNVPKIEQCHIFYSTCPYALLGWPGLPNSNFCLSFLSLFHV